MPGHEGFARILAEGLFPGAALAQSLGQLLGDGGKEGFLGGLAVIPVGAEQSDLVFHLHDDDGVLLAVDLPDAAHQGGEGLAVLLHGGGAEGGDGGHLLTVDLFGAEIGLGVPLHPGGNIHGLGILPKAEPQEAELQALTPGGGHDLLQ